MAKISIEAVLAEKVWRFTGPQKLLRRFPDFLILGPQRTGTTWLSDNLRQHPEVFVTEPKELHFFNLLTKPEDPYFSSNDLAWYLAHYHQGLRHRLRRIVRSTRRFKRFYSVKVLGEATASYAVVPHPWLSTPWFGSTLD